MEFRPPGRTDFGGHIERLIGTFMQRVHTLPGTKYSNLLEPGDYRSGKAACLTLEELEYWLIKAARAWLRAQGRQRIAQDQVFQAIEAQRKFVDEARTKTREVRR